MTARLDPARVAAGDERVGQAFLDLAREIVYRPGLEREALGEIRAMKNRIDRRLRARDQQERHVKLGVGGIRVLGRTPEEVSAEILREVKEIAELYIGIISRQMRRHGKELVVTEAAIVHLIEKGFSPAYGARFLKRTIDELVKLPVTNRWKEGSRFVADLVDESITISVG